jgi:hypothetical protein
MIEIKEELNKMKCFIYKQANKTKWDIINTNKRGREEDNKLVLKNLEVIT